MSNPTVSAAESASVDIDGASAVPAATAGRASGKETRKKLAHGPQPNVRAASSMPLARSRKAVRASR